MRSWLLPVVLAAGCWHERPPADPTPTPSLATLERPPERWPASGRSHAPRRDHDRCGRAVAHVFDVVRTDATMSGFTAAMLDDMEEASVEACHETGWSDELLGCCEDATTTSQAGECFRTMTAEQREDFERRFTDIRLRHRNAPPSPPPSP